MVSYPGSPAPDPYRGPHHGQPPSPGPIPLRPLSVGDLLGTAFTVVRRCPVPLFVVAFLAAALSNLATLGVLALTGNLRIYAEATWMEDVLRGGGSIPTSILLSAIASLVVSTVGGAMVAGVATAAAGDLAQGRDGRSFVANRLAGRWSVLFAVAVVFGVLCSVGLLLLVVPGVLAYLILVFAAPVAVMERSGVGESLRRAAQLSRGQRGRILGVTLLAGLLSGIAGTVVTTVVSSLFGSHDPATLLLITQAVGSLVAGVTGAWTGAVVALLYIDVRIRTEHLDYALRIAAASDRQRGQQVPPTEGLNPPPAG